MPGTNLTRDEAATRASLLDVTSYSIDLDLTTSDTTFGSVDDHRLHAEPGASTFADLVAADIHEITLNGRPLDPARSRRLADPARRPGRGERAPGRGVCRYCHTGEGLHRSVDPTDGTSTSTRSSRSLTPADVYTTFEQPDLKAAVRLQRHRPHRLAGRARTRRRRSPQRRSTDRSPAGTSRGPPDLHLHHRADRRLLPRRCATSTPASTARCRWGSSAASRSRSTSTATSIFEITEQGFAFFEKTFGTGYPFGKYDQLFVPEYNMGAMENAGASPSATTTSSAAAGPTPTTSPAPTRSSTRWRTCGSATS